MKVNKNNTVVFILIILLLIIIYLNYHQLKTKFNKDIIERDKQIHSLQQELLKVELPQVEKNTIEANYNKKNNTNFFIPVLFQDLNGQYRINENIELYSLPSQESDLLFQSSAKNPIEVIAVVQNSKQEKWALVHIFDFDFLSKPSIGYIEVDRYSFLKNNTESQIKVKSFEAVPNVFIGDTIDSLILLLGENYIKINDHGDIFYHFYPKDTDIVNEYYLDTAFGNKVYNLNKGIDLFISSQTNQLYKLYIYSSDFPLTSGFKVGDNAEDVLSFYETNYRKLNQINDDIEEPIIFELFEDYIISFYISNGIIDKIYILDKNSI